MQRVGGGLHFRHIFIAQVYSLVTDNHRFYKQQPVQSVICGPAIRAQIQFVNECFTSAARYSFSLRQMRFLRTEMFNRFH